MHSFTIYTDGGARGNPGIGAWAALIIDTESGDEREIGMSVAHTTNNKMELTAALSALQTIPFPSAITLYSDSQYLVKGMTEWATAWIKRNWIKSDKKPVENRELWEALIEAAKPHAIAWRWVRGHAGNAGNERVDAALNELIDEHIAKGRAVTRDRESNPF